MASPSGLCDFCFQNKVNNHSRIRKQKINWSVFLKMYSQYRYTIPRVHFSVKHVKRDKNGIVCMDTLRMYKGIQ